MQVIEGTTVASLEAKIRAALNADRIVIASDSCHRLASLIHYSLESRQRAVQRIVSPAREILTLIDVAREAGEIDEAVWRAFLGAHFARLSASRRDGSAESAARLLCAFGSEPHWTWARVAADRGRELKIWLDATHEVRSLTFGNHRSHELPDGTRLWETISSFIDLAAKVNGPINLVKAPGASGPAERFDILFRKLSRIHRFGRLGCFDFIDLLLQTGLVRDAEPGHCYLKGATGPLKGAQMIWGAKKTAELLDPLASRLAGTLGISCFVLEDALCNFQKADHEPCCNKPDDDGNCQR